MEASVWSEVLVPICNATHHSVQQTVILILENLSCDFFMTLFLYFPGYHFFTAKNFFLRESFE